MKPALLVLLGLFSVSLLSAKEAHSPLPDKIMQAKTAFIQNDSGQAVIADRAYTALKQWGRFQIVTNRESADIVFLLGTREYTAGYVTDGEAETAGEIDASTDRNGNTSGTVNATTRSSSRTVAVQGGETHLTVFDSTTKLILWSDSKTWGAGPGAMLPPVLQLFRHPSATRDVIKEFRERIEEQESKR